MIVAVLAACLLTVPVAADAQRYSNGHYGQDYRQAYGDAYRDGYNRPPRGYREHDQRGRDLRPCRSGTTGTIVGAIAGGLLGRTIDTRGDRSLGTILGLGGGALAGRAVERSGDPERCR
ncbi:glycine zipper 2TM domain-containing protein [Sphingomonas bacterium]|uniref:glycine zipper 2TM domain-containing protein n=1 Tax=Sphingomonas bacterium TaxID=1895847 RepID=UPI001575F369|nr:glycine zipper 2TM domain-containing protein [Sphingomonas bacterium]